MEIVFKALIELSMKVVSDVTREREREKWSILYNFENLGIHQYFFLEFCTEYVIDNVR